MNRLFETRPVALVDGIVIIGIGVALFAILEIEKRMQRAVACHETISYLRAGYAH